MRPVASLAVALPLMPASGMGGKEFARGEVHSNAAESFHATLERAKQGIYHYMSHQHLPLYTAEAAFHWNQRALETRVLQKGKNQGQAKTFMIRLPILEQFRNLLKLAPLCQVRRTENSGIRIFSTTLPLFGL
ncbi:transposase [Trichloromonas sp.]|uniref:transposase n=1 Tax=Trichloromonas sp. TaxID=3069249 RepID=UPI003D814855